MPVIDAPRTAPSALVAVADAPAAPAPRLGDPTCVDFSSGVGALHHTGTTSLEIDLAPMRAAAAAA